VARRAGERLRWIPEELRQCVAIVNNAKHRCQALPALFDSLAVILQVRTSRQVRDEVPLI
jgi:hypothetical protein